MHYKWFRLYSEFASDPKVQSMSEPMQRRLIMLFCLQSNGDLPKLSHEEIAFQLRIDNETLHETLQLFQRKGFLGENLQITNWDKRQYKSDTSTERVKKYRGKSATKDNETLVKRSRNVTVTPPETETETETEKKKSGDKPLSPKSSRFTMIDPPADWIQYCITQRPDLNPGKVFDDFRDYWIAMPGSKGCKLDWTATWRRWVRNTNSQNGVKHGKSKFDIARESVEAARARREQREQEQAGFDASGVSGGAKTLWP